MDEKGRYKYMEFGESKLSDNPLFFEKLKVLEGEKYILRVEGGNPCSNHQIVVERIFCGLDKCDYKILSNEYIHSV